eukprot:TRINITY_DN10138_c1_g1_i1.p1 TRINITY_DN10138_c1_g1~~TRINITY_DN10138_c1_g1_i1.p1  ORF type:complete len:1152 (+),score=217.92 TRINITY_DN10138_c1_g1_i1:38-3457(+)
MSAPAISVALSVASVSVAQPLVQDGPFCVAGRALPRVFLLSAEGCPLPEGLQRLAGTGSTHLEPGPVSSFFAADSWDSWGCSGSGPSVRWACRRAYAEAAAFPSCGAGGVIAGGGTLLAEPGAGARLLQLYTDEERADLRFVVHRCDVAQHLWAADAEQLEGVSAVCGGVAERVVHPVIRKRMAAQQLLPWTRAINGHALVDGNDTASVRAVAGSCDLHESAAAGGNVEDTLQAGGLPSVTVPKECESAVRRLFEDDGRLWRAQLSHFKAPAVATPPPTQQSTGTTAEMSGATTIPKSSIPPLRSQGFFCTGGHALPDTYLLGAPKCGTTQMFKQLREHVGVVSGEKKEHHWYDWEKYEAQCTSAAGCRKHYAHAHKKGFPACGDVAAGRRVIDGSPSYFSDGDAPARAWALHTAEERRKVRFVVMLCDPVRRFESHHNYDGTNYVILKAFAGGQGVWVDSNKSTEELCEDAVAQPVPATAAMKLSSRAASPGAWLSSRGWYAAALQRWAAAGWAPSQFLLVSSAQFFLTPSETVDAVQRFLGYDTQKPQVTIPPRTPRAKLDEFKPEGCRQRMAEWYGTDLRKLRELIAAEGYPHFPGDAAALFDQLQHVRKQTLPAPQQQPSGSGAYTQEAAAEYLSGLRADRERVVLAHLHIQKAGGTALGLALAGTQCHCPVGIPDGMEYGERFCSNCARRRIDLSEDCPAHDARRKLHWNNSIPAVLNWLTRGWPCGVHPPLAWWRWCMETESGKVSLGGLAHVSYARGGRPGLPTMPEFRRKTDAWRLHRNTQCNGLRLLYVTSLRDPFQRFLSEWKHCRSIVPLRSEIGCWGDPGINMSLTAAASLSRSLLENRQAKMLGGAFTDFDVGLGGWSTARWVGGSPIGEVGRRAKEMLRDSSDLFFGLAERMRDTLCMLEIALGPEWGPFVLPTKDMHRRGRRHELIERGAPPDVERLWRSRNAMDIELYERAVKIFEVRFAAARRLREQTGWPPANTSINCDELAPSETPSPPQKTEPCVSKNCSIESGGHLRAGDVLRSRWFKAELRMQHDGNLVLYSMPSMQPVWSTDTSRDRGAVATLTEGVLAVRKSETVLWRSPSKAGHAVRAAVLDDCTLRTYSMDGTELWVSGNSGCPAESDELAAA